MKVYVASSWKNLYQPEVVAALRVAGHDVYDFRRPIPGDDGFHWSEIDGGWKSWSVAEYAEALEHPVAARGFASDMAALDAADLVVLVLPSGRSASWEYGHWCGRTGQQGIVHIPEKVEPELMYRGSWFTWEIDGLVAAVNRWTPRCGRPGCDHPLSEHVDAGMGVRCQVMIPEVAQGHPGQCECRKWLPKSSGKLVAMLESLRPTPNLPFEVWSAIGQLVVQPAVELVIEDERGQILLTRRDDEHWHGWHVPGGFMAPGESIQQACTRVARRELGVDVWYKEIIDVVAWPSHPYVNMVSLFCKCAVGWEVKDGRLAMWGRPKDGTFFAAPPTDGMIPVHAGFIENRLRRSQP